jgi:hypothetical protein
VCILQEGRSGRREEHIPQITNDSQTSEVVGVNLKGYEGLNIENVAYIIDGKNFYEHMCSLYAQNSWMSIVLVSANHVQVVDMGRKVHRLGTPLCTEGDTYCGE